MKNLPLKLAAAMSFLTLQTMVAPGVWAAPITLTITETYSVGLGHEVLTINSGGLNVTLNPAVLTRPPVGATGWDIDTMALNANPFTFATPFLGPTFLLSEPDPAFVNSLMIATTNHITVVSDVSLQGVGVTPNNTAVQIGTDTNGNAISVVFNDIPTPDPRDTVPEPATALLLIPSVLALLGFTRKRSRFG